MHFAPVKIVSHQQQQENHIVEQWLLDSQIILLKLKNMKSLNSLQTYFHLLRL